MHAVFLDADTFSPDVSLNAIRQITQSFTSFSLTQESEIIERAINAGIIITNKVILNKEVLKQLPQLKLICIAATGTNNIDIDEAKKLNIAVTNVSGYARNSVAQYVFSQILDYYSKTTHHHENVHQGLWQNSPSFCYHGEGSNELAGKTIGLIGYGNLAKAVESVAQAFNMTVLIAERPNAVSIRADRVPFTTAIQTADIISLHCPLTIETEGLIDKNILKKMKSTAMLINTARGGIINEYDLFNALINHEISYAVLDVLSQEPPQEDHILLRKQPSNLKITAHIAWASIESQQHLIDLIAVNIADYQQGKLTNRVDV